jgi:hypothetical protein
MKKCLNPARTHKPMIKGVGPRHEHAHFKYMVFRRENKYCKGSPDLMVGATKMTPLQGLVNDSDLIE